MIRTLSSVLLAALISTVACAQNQPANTTTAPSPTQSTPGQPASAGMMGNQGMMGGGQGMMGPGMMDGGSGMMGGQPMMGGGQGNMGTAMMDGGPGMMGGQGMMGGPGMMDMLGMGEQCPMLLPGASVQTKDTKDGLVMTFTATGDVTELRRRVRVMADHMNAHSAGASGGMGMHGGGMMGADAGMGMMGGSMMGGMMPAMNAQVEDVDHGARLKLTPADPAKLNQMREHMKQHAQMMNQSHGCSIMVDAGR